MYIWVAYFVLEIMEMPFFAAFMILIILWWLWMGIERCYLSPNFLWVLAEIGQVLALSVDDRSSFFGNEIDTLLPQSTISWEDNVEKE